MRVQVVAPGALVVLLLASCGTGTGTGNGDVTAAGDQPRAGSTTAARSPSGGSAGSGTVPPHSPGVISGPAGTLDVTVSEPATRGTRAVRFLRVEDSTGKNVLERSFRSTPAQLADYLPTGDYRLITWVRNCPGPCGNDPEQKLGDPTQVCGTKFTVTAGAVATLRVQAPQGEDCTIQAS